MVLVLAAPMRLLPTARAIIQNKGAHVLLSFRKRFAAKAHPCMRASPYIFDLPDAV